MYKFNLVDAGFDEIQDAFISVMRDTAEYKSMSDLYFLWHPRTEYDFVVDYVKSVNPNSWRTDEFEKSNPDVIAIIHGIKVHSYCNRNTAEKELIIFVDQPS